jgi:acetylornithine/succinyldiaminopimelate/putrescine aminotransferase
LIQGISLGSLSATWDKNYQELFMPLVPGFTHFPANKLDKLEAALTDNTAAVIMEVVQGEGGVPMGRILRRSSINLSPKNHTSTFGGNPLACAAALASIDFIIEEKLPQRALAAGDYFRMQLNELNHPLIKEVRGPGLMISVDLKEKAGRFVQKLTDQGVLALLAGANVIRFLPPLVITNDEIDRVVTALKTVLDS